MRRNHRGLILIELLVAISVLVALLPPAVPLYNAIALSYPPESPGIEPSGSEDSNVAGTTSEVQSEIPRTLVAPFTAADARQAQEEWAAFLRTDVIEENAIGMQLTIIPPGEFTMGLSDAERAEVMRIWPETTPDEIADERHCHRVRFTNPSCVGIHEVTVRQFRSFIDDSDYVPEPTRDGEGGWGWDQTTGQFSWNSPRPNSTHSWESPGLPRYGTAHPVVIVTWNDAIAFCNWMSYLEGRPEFYRVLPDSETRIHGGTGYRLLTEAEWEYCCRAGTESIYSCGDVPEDLVQFGNVADRSASSEWDEGFPFLNSFDERPFTAPVGSYMPNAFGLYDMHGNVLEWCYDVYDAEAYLDREGVVENPVVDSGDPAFRVQRGGAWFVHVGSARSSARTPNAPSFRGSDIGFRIARTLDIPAQPKTTD